MKKIHYAMVLCLVAVSWSLGTVAQNERGPTIIQGWPFGDSPQAESVNPVDEFLITIGALAQTPGSLVSTDLGISFRVGPFFTECYTQLLALPTFGMAQSLETGIDFEWWMTSVDVDLSLSPWSLISTGGWLEFHPPQWVLLTAPWLTVDGSLGWGPRWTPTAEWFHTLDSVLDIQASWSLDTLWGQTLELIAESNAGIEWTFPNGGLITEWMFQLDARSILPLFANSEAALRAGARAQIGLLPVFGLGFDVRLEFRADPFTAYGLIGAGAEGIHAEAGVDWSIGWLLFDGLQ